MERFPVELLYVLLFVGLVLFNYFLQAARRRRQEEQAQVEAAPPPVAEEPLEDIWGRSATPAAVAPVVTPRPPVLAMPAQPHAPPRIHPVRALLRDKRDLRRAVVLMIVLGPCRSEERPER